jgi:hypothetical protein
MISIGAREATFSTAGRLRIERAVTLGYDWQGERSNAVKRQPGATWRSWSFWGKLGGAVIGILLLVVAGAIYWLKSSARAQREAVEAIKADRGQVYYSWNDPDVENTPEALSRAPFLNWLHLLNWSNGDSEEPGPAAPAWLVSLLGVDCFGDVTSVMLPLRMSGKSMERIGDLENLRRLRIHNSVLSDRELRSLGRLTHLESLAIVRTRFFKGGFAHLANLKNLRSLNLQNSGFDDEAALAILKNLTALTELNLAGTAITDFGMEALRGLINLEDLNLNRTRVGDPGLSHLGGLSSLASIDLNRTSVTGTGLNHLANLPRLEVIDLEESGLTDTGLAQLAKAASLKILRLKGTAIGDEGVAHLTGLTNLEELTLDRTRITDAALAGLAAMPHLVILSVQNTRVTSDAVTAQIRKRAHLQVQQLNASSTGVVAPETAIRELEIVH